MADSILFRVIALLSTLFTAVLPYFLPLGGAEIVHPSRLADPDGGFVRIENETLYYTHTPGRGETIVLIHGFGGSTVTWWNTIPALAAAGYDVYAIDLLGFGLSGKGWNHDYSHAAQAERVIRLMDVMGLDRVHMVGHSMGGNVAAYIALTYPERVDHLVLVAAAILDGDGAWGIPAFLLKPPFLRRWGQFLIRRALAPMFENLLFDAAYADDKITPEIEDGYRRALFTPEWDLGLMGITRDAGQNALPAPVSDIHAPTLILWGAEDAWVSPDDGVRLENLIPGAQRVELAGAGHLLMHEAPEAFNAVLLAFLGEAE
jgi:pimeloyl-ACP methyl ester carboxylesterase